MKDRNKVDIKYKWDLKYLFKSDKDWERSFLDFKKNINKIEAFKNKKFTRANILKCLSIYFDLSQKLSNLYVYAKMRLDEDAGVSVAQQMYKQVESVYVEFSESTSYIMPKLAKLSEKEIKQYISDKDFENYSYMFQKLLKAKEHILSEKEEELLAGMGSFVAEFKNAFSMFNNLEIKFDDIKDKDKLLPMSHGMYSQYLVSEDRNIRKQAYNSMFKPYRELIETLTAIYSGNVKSNCFAAQAKKYKNAMAAAIENEDVKEEVYNTLLDVINKNLKTLDEYLCLRRTLLKLDELTMYDMHVPLFKDLELKLEYEEAFALVKKALLIFGDDYQNILNLAQKERWIDVYENKGKRSGAYSWGTYSSRPYVLLNYYPTTNSIFTIAHELGHSIHSYYSNKNQPYEKASYEIFVAEVASTVNEILLLKYLIKNAKSKKEEVYFLNYYLDMMRTTVFRQTQFAEFEKKAHEMHEKGIPLTSDLLCNMYLELNKKYYKSAVSDENIKYEWARIPHFYSAFYVYKYATGFISAVNIVKQFEQDNKKAFKKYEKFLSAGGSMSPLDILKLVDVDLTTKEPFEIAMKEFVEIFKKLRDGVKHGN